MFTPWMKFYTSDWLSETKLRLVSRAARSLWIDMICLMHQAGTGRLEVSGRPMSNAELATILGDNPRTTKKLLAELSNAGISKVVDGSFVCSSRVIHEFEKVEGDRANGRKGGNPALKTRDFDEKWVNPGDKAKKLEARYQKERKKDVDDAGEDRENPVIQFPAKIPPNPGIRTLSNISEMTFRERILTSIGVDPVSGMCAQGRWRGTLADMRIAGQWISDLGLTEDDVVSTVDEVMRRRSSGQQPPSSFNYFTRAMQDLAGSAQKPITATEGGDTHDRRKQDASDRTRDTITSAAAQAIALRRRRRGEADS